MAAVGEAAALIAAFTWSATSVAMARLSTRTTPVAMSALRLSVASLLLPFVLLISGEAGELGDASARTIFAMAGSGILAYTVGDTLYIAALAEIGVQRAFTITMTLFISLTVAGGVLLLDESVRWYQGIGGVLVAGGILLIVRARAVPGRHFLGRRHALAGRRPRRPR
jgi:drug/metabolite transporter (DMT)-like permease